MKHPPTKFEVMRRNRIIAAARTRIEDAWELGYDEPGDPMVEAMRESVAKHRALAVDIGAYLERHRRPRHWWWPLGWVRS